MVDLEDSFRPLCEDLLISILFRLSDRDLLKCKCVSKEWHRIVSRVCVPQMAAKAPVSGLYFRVAQGDEVPFVSTFCPQDLKDKLHHLVACHESVHYVGTASLELPIQTYWDSSCVDVPCSPKMSLASLLPFDHRGPDFLDSCNGMLLFVQRPKPRFCVCNPAVRQCVSIPPPPPSIHLSSLYAPLAFDPSESIEYKVVTSTLTTRPQCLHVFYSLTGEWKTHKVQVELPAPANSFKLVRHSIYLKNSIYRLSMFYKILCIDLKSLKACVLDCPSQKASHTHSMHKKDQPPPGCIGVSNGLLSYATDEDGFMCVWFLDNPNESSEWTLKYKISYHYLWKYAAKHEIYGSMIWLRCCGFHPTCDILFLSCATSILVYHIGSGHIETLCYLNRLEWHCGYFFPIYLHKTMFVTLKNWCLGINYRVKAYEDKVIEDQWCYYEL